MISLRLRSRYQRNNTLLSDSKPLFTQTIGVVARYNKSAKCTEITDFETAEANSDKRYAFIGRNFNSINNNGVLIYHIMRNARKRLLYNVGPDQHAHPCSLT